MTVSRSNRPRLEDLRAMAVGAIAALPADVLALLQDDAEAALAAALRRDQGKDTGTVRFADGPVTVVADLAKKVEWDQDTLTAVVDRIRVAGDDPSEYVETTLRVSERAYAAWPGHIRAAFEPARTVKTAKPAFRLTILSGDPS